MRSVTVSVILAWKFPVRHQTNGAERATECKTETFCAMDSLLSASQVWKMASTDNSVRLEVRVMNFSFSSLWFENRHGLERCISVRRIFFSAIRIKQTLWCFYTVACRLKVIEGRLYWCWRQQYGKANSNNTVSIKQIICRHVQWGSCLIIICQDLQVRGLYVWFVTWYVLRLGVVCTSPNQQSQRTTPCRLSATAYSKYTQIPSILEAFPPSTTWGRAMPWWQGTT